MASVAAEIQALREGGGAAYEGELLRKIRVIVGPDTPVVASYDIHLHLTPEMCKHADATVVFHTSPHVDIFETGERSAVVMEALLRGAAPATAARGTRARMWRTSHGLSSQVKSSQVKTSHGTASSK